MEQNLLHHRAGEKKPSVSFEKISFNLVQHGKQKESKQNFQWIFIL